MPNSQKKPQNHEKVKKLVITSVVILLLICSAVAIQWKTSGSSLPFHMSEPDDPSTRAKLKELFPNTKETVINSIMMRCYQRNYLDTSGTYEEFINYFHNEQELNNYIIEETCPKEGHRS